MDLYAPQSTVDAQGRRILMAWLRMPQPVDGKWQGMMSIPRVVEVKERKNLFPCASKYPKMYIQKRLIHQKKLQTQDIDYDFLCRTERKLMLEDIVSSVRVKKICTDRSTLYTAFPQFRTEFATPELADGFNLEVYVDQNLIEVFVNEGEAVISNAVYQLGNEIKVQGNVSVAIETLE